jgi:uroporphyrinogen decarboxylase
MDSRERTFRALAHEEPDRVPIDFWSSSGLDRSLGLDRNGARRAFLDQHDVDLRYIDGPRYVGPPLGARLQEMEKDIWGVTRRRVSVWATHGREDYKEVYQSPLASASTPEDVDAYRHWPSPDWFDYSDIARQCVEVRREGRVAVFMGDRLNRVAQLKPAMYLRGVEQILVDMASNPPMVEAIIGRICSFYLVYLERILEAAAERLDIVLTGDDFGAQNGPLISPRMWITYLGAGFARFVSLAQEAGVRVMHHTCGSVYPIVPLMLERGLDILQSLQPEAANMDPRSLKSEFGDRLAFHGGISIQRTLPFGSPEEVRLEVKQKVEALGLNGGYIACTAHNIQADTPPENVIALFQAYRDFGRY